MDGYFFRHIKNTNILIKEDKFMPVRVHLKKIINVHY